MIGHDVIWPKILPGPIRGLCVDARPKRGFWSWALQSTLSGQYTLNFAELDTFSGEHQSNIVNQRPLSVRSFIDEDL